ncbi:MAG: AAA family ATPase [Clostridia bacterium]|nr:AAA family ATPase [Clostridia bacterium]
MKNAPNIKLNIDEHKLYLHSKINVYKTEKFVKSTKFILAIDVYLERVANSIIYALSNKTIGNDGCYKLTLDSQDFTLFFVCAKALGDKTALNANDIIFYKLIAKDKLDKTNDQTIQKFLNTNKNFTLELSEVERNIIPTDFKKLYILTGSDGVCFPLLNKEQLGIVNLENKNVLVQGVAGSGKTNICIDKIVFTACREYVGRVLYTTFSRGLLMDTKFKVEAFKDKLVNFVNKVEKGYVVYLDTNHKEAVENKLGVFLDCNSDKAVLDKLKTIIRFLDTHVDYYLLEDIYKKHINDKCNIAQESYFINTYLKNIKNHQLTSKLDKIKHLSYEIIYKEIYGLIYGACRNGVLDKMTLNAYIDERKNSFSKADCETIYSVAEDYYKHLNQAGYMDNNLITRALLNGSVGKYSLSIIDEVQDFTELNLTFIKKISLKVFAVGDAMQMINPTYFSFSYLKRLLYEKDVVDVIELKHNYRNTKTISTIVSNLNKINITSFGTHNFVIESYSVDDSVMSSVIFVKEADFINRCQKEKYEDLTIIVSDKKQKEYLQKQLPTIEILTVSEIKGLERDNVMLYNLVASNKDKWDTFNRLKISKKVADENSVYRYYYNLLYVGLTRAKQNVIVYEDSVVSQFDDFYKDNFMCLNAKTAIDKMNTFVRKNGVDILSMIDRVNEFIKLEQFDNAYFAANKISDGKLKQQCIDKITIYKDYVFKGEHRVAGIKFWEKGLILEAKQEFVLSKDETLIDLMDASVTTDNKKLSLDILDYYLDIVGSDIAKNMTLNLLREDINTLHEQNKFIKNKFGAIRSKK